MNKETLEKELELLSKAYKVGYRYIIVNNEGCVFYMYEPVFVDYDEKLMADVYMSRLGDMSYRYMRKGCYSNLTKFKPLEIEKLLKENSDMKKIYISSNIYIGDICTCERCRERGELEFIIVDDDGQIIDYIGYKELFNIYKFKEKKLKEICDLLYEKLLKGE